MITRSTQSESAGCGEVGTTVTFVPVGGAVKTKQNNSWNQTGTARTKPFSSRVVLVAAAAAAAVVEVVVVAAASVVSTLLDCSL